MLEQRLPIRWRLALTSATLTFLILCVFALVVGELTERRMRDDFRRQVASAADKLQQRVLLERDVETGRGRLNVDARELAVFSGTEDAAVRVVSEAGDLLAPPRARDLGDGPPFPASRVVRGYRVETREILVRPFGRAFLQYGRPISGLEATTRRVRFFLFFGVLGGAALALLGGLVVARRAMSPIARLTADAEEIRRTRDPRRRVEVPEAEDEIAQLARTLDGMLRALDESRTETEALLLRQREFVADASHELRTPLTSVLANLELLAETLDGEQGETADSALRSARRMRRLVADLLLLARADARREAPAGPVDLAAVLVDAASEAGAAVGDRELTVDPEPTWVEGRADDLHRLALNLLENALRHTPPGTHVRARVGRDGDEAVLVVEDDGPGVPPELRERVFERFVRGQGDRGRSFGLGLSIVRAVAEEHGGHVVVEDAAPGARFVVRLPAAVPAEAPAPVAS